MEFFHPLLIEVVLIGAHLVGYRSTIRCSNSRCIAPRFFGLKPVFKVIVAGRWSFAGICLLEDDAHFEELFFFK